MSGPQERASGGSIDLSIDFAGIRLLNPVLLASGTCGYGAELAPFVDLEKLGGIVAKSLTLEPRTGNRPLRIVETAAGMLNAISLENVGVEVFVREKLPALPAQLPVVASVFETEIARYAEGKINDVPGFKKFLQDNAAWGNGVQAKAE